MVKLAHSFEVGATEKVGFLPKPGYPTVLVHLAKVRLADLRDVLEEAWRRNAPKRLVTEFDAAAKAPKAIRGRKVP